MIVNDRDLGPQIPIALARYTYGHKFAQLDTWRGWRASKHFCIAPDSGQTALKHWYVIGPHGSANKGYPKAENALEMADFLEQQPVDWSTLHNGALELTVEMQSTHRAKSTLLGGWH